MKNYGMVCPPPQNQKEGKNPSRSYHNHLPPFFGDFGVFRRQMCPVTSGRVDNCVRVGQRPYACLTISGSGVRCAANARHYGGLHIRFPWWKHCKTGVIPRPVYSSVWPGYGPYTGHSLLRVPGIGLVLPTRPQVRVCAILIPWSGYPEQDMSSAPWPGYKKWYIPWAGYEQCTLARVWV